MQPELAITIAAASVAIIFVIGIFFRERWQAGRQIAALKMKLQSAENARTNANTQLQAMLHASRQFVEASSEQEIIAMVINLSMQLTGAMGASFVPLDERGQPAAAIRQGEFPFPLPDAWLEYLASPTVRQACALCQQTETLVERNCNLLKGPFSDALGLYCFPLRHAGKELGLLNLYMPDPVRLDGEDSDFLRMLLDATALALDGERLRSREMQTLARLRSAPRQSDLNTALSGMLAEVQETLGADFAMLALAKLNSIQQTSSLPDGSAFLCAGELSSEEHEAAQSIIQHTFTSQEQQMQTKNPAWLLAVPLRSVDQALSGVLLLGERHKKEGAPGEGQTGFTSRQLALAHSAADQMALVVQNANQMMEVQYRAMIEERTRLAREIHDGLAQTLGFLKLQVAQMQGFQERGDQERLRQMMRVSYDALAEAYRDVREAIDMLRIAPDSNGSYSLQGWLQQIVAEFFDNGSLQPFKIELSDLEMQANLPPEVHAQLIRVVQEALSNARKHARASRVVISCREVEGDLVLEVRDDGQGFSADDIPGPSQHGLRGMRERAELIGADFQVISRTGEGTTVRVRLPLDEAPRILEW